MLTSGSFARQSPSYASVESKKLSDKSQQVGASASPRSSASASLKATEVLHNRGAKHRLGHHSNGNFIRHGLNAIDVKKSIELERADTIRAASRNRVNWVFREYLRRSDFRCRSAECPCLPAYGVVQQQQYHCADECYEDAPEIKAGHAMTTQRPK